MKIIKIFLFFTVFVILESCTISKFNNKSNSHENYGDFPENYIPQNLDEALTYLNSTWTENDKEEFKNMNEDEAVAELHMGTGRSIRNDWGLWAKKKNALTKYFNSLGISHPDDMSSIILTSFHRQLNGIDINLEKQTEKYIKYWEHIENNKKKREEKNKPFAVGDTIKVPFMIMQSGNEISFNVISNSSDIDDFDCVVNGVIKNKKNKGLLTIQVLDICGYEKVKIGNFKITIGQTFEHDIRYFKIIF